MKARLIIIAGVVLMAVCSYCHPYEACAQEQLNTLTARMLDEKLAEYFKAIQRQSVEVKKEECDFLIGTCVDTLMRQHVALTAFRHYRDSRIMGDEAVAIHIFDDWFASGKVAMPDDMEKLSAKVFAEFNRQSQIGNKAPGLTLHDMDGQVQTIFAGPHDRFSVLYFYDSSCVTCKAQTIMLDRLMSENEFPIDLYAVYASDNETSWKNYVSENFSGDYGAERVFHLWDPEIESDFQRKYGVLQTPRMYLINPKGTIKGRGLDADALSVMLRSVFDGAELTYGSDESMALYDGLFDDAPTAKEVRDVVDYVADGTLKEGEYVLFRQMAGDLLYYLSTKRGEGFKEGLDYLIDEYVLARGDIWKTSDDSLKIVGMARMHDDLLSRSEPGSMVPDIKVRGESVSSRKSRIGDVRLRKLKGDRNIIIFYTEGCSICAAEKHAARGMVASDKDLNVLMINVDDVLMTSPQMASVLFDSFDLSTLPFIIQTDRKGRIVRRYISLVE